MYILLHGAKKNVGDFLIRAATKRLLRSYLGDVTFKEYPRWVSLDDKIEEVNASKAIIIAGGPGYSRGFYPEVYPLTSDLTRLQRPIVPLGLGWVGRPSSSPERFSFSSASLDAIRCIHDKVSMSSVRDFLTRDILVTNGIRNVSMTGCPSWYFGGVKGPFRPPQKIQSIAVSMPQNKIYFAQSLELLDAVRRLFGGFALVRSYVAVFHRGLRADRHTTDRQAQELRELSKEVSARGYDVVDASYELERLTVYEEADVHIGYRVHAHIFNLGLRKPSFLLWEDGRGRGLSEALGLACDVPGMHMGNARRLRMEPLERGSNLLHRAIWKLGLHKHLVVNDAAVRAMTHNLATQVDKGFPAFEGLEASFQRGYGEMERFLATIPR